MDERLLNTFLTVARLGSFTRAAEVLYVAQSTVTARIQELERELGVALFVREGRAIALTGAGRTFIRYAQRSVQSLEEGRAALAAAGARPAGQLRVMASHVPAAYDLPKILANFHPNSQPAAAPHLRPTAPEALPDAQGAATPADKPMPAILLRTASSKRVFRAMLRGEADLGLVTIRFRHPAVRTEVVAERPLAVVAAPNLAGGGARAGAGTGAGGSADSPGLLVAGTPLLFFEEEMEDALLANSVAQELGWPVSGCMGIGDMTVLKRLLVEGLGAGILPREAIEPELKAGLLQELTEDLTENVTNSHSGPRPPALPQQITCVMVRKEAETEALAGQLAAFLDVLNQYYAARRGHGTGGASPKAGAVGSGTPRIATPGAGPRPSPSTRRSQDA